MVNSSQSVREANRRFKRKWRRQKRQVESITQQADQSIDKYVFRRFGRLYVVRRFVAGWLALLLFIALGSAWQVRGLDQYYLELKPTGGGVYREGILGSFTTANPLFAVNPVDTSVSKLVFSGLFKISPSGELEPDLAEKFEVNADGTTYKVFLKEDVLWHDGEVFTAEDVVYTYTTIKNPNARSPLFSSWRDVDVMAIDQSIVEFRLPNSLSSFKYSLTNGIVPEHLLRQVDASDLRASQFNTVSAIGTGPFKYNSVEVIGVDPSTRQEKITLNVNKLYHRPHARLDGVLIRTYKNEEALIDAFKSREIFAIAGLRTVPDTLNDGGTTVLSTPLASAVYLFMNTSTPFLSDVNLRKALAHATKTDEIRNRIGTAIPPVDSPFLRSHFTYNMEKRQIGYDLDAAKKLLDEAGWVAAMDGYRSKDGAELKVRLVSQSLTEYATVVQEIQKQWGELGVEVEALLLPEEDVQSSAVVRHDYDILLYGIALGPDPDVFAFWHSSQADVSLRSRLNLSEFTNSAADLSLEAGRTRGDDDLRNIKYQPFVDAWISEVPAIGLYQPRFQLVVSGPIEGYVSGQFNSITDRYYSITDWQIRREQTVKL